MSAENTILLTIEQAKESVCFDLRQYGPQILLFCEILRLMLPEDVALENDIQKGGVWISTSAPGRHMRWLAGEELVTYLCETLASTDLDLEKLALICSRVFQSRVVPEVNRETGLTGLRIATGMEAFHCRQCGRCCTFLDYHAEITPEDVRRWEALERTDILEWVGQTRTIEGQITYQVWMVPGTRQLAQTCPFLHEIPSENRRVCRIHEVKPAICRNYPVSRKHARMTGCRGFEQPPSD